MCARLQVGIGMARLCFCPQHSLVSWDRRVGFGMHCGTFRIGSLHRVLGSNEEGHLPWPWEGRIRRRLLE